MSEKKVKKKPKKEIEDIRIYDNDYLAISRILEAHHSIFYKMWEMGKPCLEESCPSACVKFERKHGTFAIFSFNPQFWASLDNYNRAFIIAHESLHVILNHGYRGLNAIDHDRANVAMDIVVNHLLTKKFGFFREKIKNEDKLCWIDTVFKNKAHEILSDETFEYYYNKILEKCDCDKCSKKYFLVGGKGLMHPDDHGNMVPITPEELKDILDTLEEMIPHTKGERDKIRKILEKHFSGDDQTEVLKKMGLLAGLGAGGWFKVNPDKMNKKKKWETIIKDWTRRHLSTEYHDVEQWTRTNRRFTMLKYNIFLPTDVEEERIDKDMIDVFFFQDTSGSCYDYADRFFKAARSLPKNKFNVRLFCFDTEVHETDLQSGKLYGGGGTAFDIIESKIQQVIAKENKSYPHIWVITDGMGSPVNPQYPKKWYWFLTENYRNYIPKESHVYQLEDFE